MQRTVLANAHKQMPTRAQADSHKQHVITEIQMRDDDIRRLKKLVGEYVSMFDVLLQSQGQCTGENTNLKKALEDALAELESVRGQLASGMSAEDVQKMTHDITIHVRTISELQEANDSLEQKNTDWAEQLSQRESEWQKFTDEMEARLREMEGRHEGEISRITIELETAQQEKAAAAAQNEQFEGALEHLHLQIKLLEEAAEAAEGKMRLADEKERELHDQIIKWKSDYEQEHRGRIQSQERNDDHIHKFVLELRKLHEAHGLDQNGREKTINGRIDGLDHLKELLAQLQVSSQAHVQGRTQSKERREQQISELQSELTKAKALLHQNALEIQQKNEEIDRLRKIVEENKSKFELIVTLERDNARLQQELQQHRETGSGMAAHNGDLEAQLRELEKALKIRTREGQGVADRLSALTDEANKTIKALQRENTGLLEQKDRLKRELTRVTASDKKKAELLRTAHKKIELLEQKIRTDESVPAERRSEWEADNKRIIEILEQQLREARAGSSEREREMDAEIQSLTAQLRQGSGSSTDTSDLERENQRMAEELEREQRIKQELMIKIEGLESGAGSSPREAELEQMLKALEGTVAHLKSQNGELRAAQESDKQNFDGIQHQLTIKIEGLQNLIQELEGKLVSAGQQSADTEHLTAQIKDMVSRVADMQEELAKEKLAREKAVQEAAEQQEQFDREKAEWDARVQAEIEKTMGQIRIEFEKQEKEIAEGKQVSADSLARQRELENQLRELQSELNSNESKLSQMRERAAQQFRSDKDKIKQQKALHQMHANKMREMNEKDREQLMKLNAEEREKVLQMSQQEMENFLKHLRELDEKAQRGPDREVDALEQKHREHKRMMAGLNSAWGAPTVGDLARALQ